MIDSLEKWLDSQKGDVIGPFSPDNSFRKDNHRKYGVDVS
jgi:hypothetical protein